LSFLCSGAGPGKAVEDVVGFVLAGGRSSRMGADKALVQLGGHPLVAYAIGILREAGLTVSIAGGKPELATFATVVEDRQPGLGPLSGICSALASTTAQWAVFTSVDLPLLPPSLVACLLRHAMITGSTVTVPSVNGFAQTFPAVVARAASPVFERELSAGRGGCFSAFEAAAADVGEALAGVPVEMLVQCGQIAHPLAIHAALWFLNVNTIEDLHQAEVHSPGAHRVS
jgi:molybdenum cofactor guanylyltransferase